MINTLTLKIVGVGIILALCFFLGWNLKKNRELEATIRGLEAQNKSLIEYSSKLEKSNKIFNDASKILGSKGDAVMEFNELNQYLFDNLGVRK